MLRNEIENVKQLEKIWDLGIENVTENKGNEFKKKLTFEGKSIEFTLSGSDVYLNNNVMARPDIIEINPMGKERGCQTKKEFINRVLSAVQNGWNGGNI